MNNDLLEKVTSILREVLGSPNLAITEATSASDVEGWDSFAHINLIMGLEDAYKIQFSTAEIGSMGRVADLISVVRGKLQQQAAANEG
ncbi:MAG TPA: acyl carrier protein [Prosthecobacter sp.]|nr:acyl carrier protein [Prosthecobacter sp.]